MPTDLYTRMIIEIDGEPVRAHRMVRPDGSVWVAPIGSTLGDPTVWREYDVDKREFVKRPEPDPMLPLDDPASTTGLPVVGNIAGVPIVVDPNLDVAGGWETSDGPVLPYPDARAGATSGWSGSDTSRERAETADADGTTTERQQAILRYLQMMGTRGATWLEVAEHFDWHHGQASGALSNLHKVGLIARLRGGRRGGCAVYVLPEHVAGRDVVEQGRNAPPSITLERLAEVLQAHTPEPMHPMPVCSCDWTGNDYAAHLMAVATDA